MKYSGKLILLIAFIAGLFAACRKDTFNQTDITIMPDPLVEINTDASGFVVDESGQPIEAATVRLGTSSTLSDEKGYFRLNGITSQMQPFVSAEKSGYLPSLASFSAKAGDVGRVVITLKAKPAGEMIQAGTGGQVNVSGGGSINFKANSFVTTSGQSYTGTVVVYATYLDPSKSQTSTMIPGSYLGRNAEGEVQVLHSFGMIHALLETPAGEKLQLSQSAEITVPVPSDRLSAAPAEIPLWSIDESTSLWKEEGTAQLNGSEYKGEVSHFSWWNCDASFPVITLSGTLRLGNHHPYVEIRITRPNGSSLGTTPSANGFFSGSVPANEVLILEVINECGDVVYTETIGPYSDDVNLGIISLNWNNDWVEISGTLLNCNQDPVTNGFVSASINNQSPLHFPVSLDPVTGEFSAALVDCGGTEVTLYGYDLDALKTTENLTMSVSPQVDFGNVIACDAQIIQGLRLELSGGAEKFIPDITATFDANPGTGNLYHFVVRDIQGVDGVIYEYYFLDWNQNPADPLWAFNFTNQLIGSPVVYEMDSQTGTIEAIEQGTLPGEQVIFKLTNVTITEKPSNISYPNSTATFTAVLQ